MQARALTMMQEHAGDALDDTLDVVCAVGALAAPCKTVQAAAMAYLEAAALSGRSRGIMSGASGRAY